MRRDLCYFFPADIHSVYKAFLTAAQNPPFERTCTEETPFIFSFGLNFSWKYNMNGGAMTLRCMPYSNGTAVNLRFSIAQGAGARYEKYANNLLSYTVPILRVGAQPCKVPIESFMDFAEGKQVVSQPTPAAIAPAPVVPEPVMPEPVVAQPAPIVVQPAPVVAQPAPVEMPVATPAPAPAAPVAPVAATAGKTCSACGASVPEDAKFCSRCGASLEAKRFCCGCGLQLQPGARFCQRCGRKADT